MCFIADGIADIYRTKPTTARKAHKCYECGQLIAPGEQYLYHFQVFDGGHWSIHVCRSCAFIRQSVHEDEIAAGCAEHESWPPFGSLYDDIQAHPEAVKRWRQPAPAEFQITESA